MVYTNIQKTIIECFELLNEAALNWKHNHAYLPEVIGWILFFFALVWAYISCLANTLGLKNSQISNTS